MRAAVSASAASASGGPAARADPHPQLATDLDRLICRASREQAVAIFDWPTRDYRGKGGLRDRRTRSVSPALDPALLIYDPEPE